MPKMGFNDHRRGRSCFAVSGFSLIELLAVLALLLILTTLYWGPRSTSRQRQSLNDCQKNLQKIDIAMEIYANDHGGKYPEVTGARASGEVLDALVPRYTADTASFVCPGSADPPLLSVDAFRSRKISYAYYMGRSTNDPQQVLMSDRQVDTRSKAQGEFVFSSTGRPPGNNHQKAGGNLLFGDGHVEITSPRASVPLVITQGVVLLNP